MGPRPARSILLAFALLPMATIVLTITESRCFAVQPGYVESFPGTSTAGWTGGTIPTNPGAGGVSGGSDGYLFISRTSGGHLGANASTAPYTGDWLTAGITQVSLWLDDVNQSQNLEIHFSLGDAPANYWQYNVGFIPPPNRWAQFTVNVLDSTQFTQIFGTESFAGALQNVNKVHVRHQKAPYGASPDTITGDFGLDELFLNAPGAAGVDVGAAGAGRPVQLSPPSPNPSRGPVALTLRTWDDSPVTLEVVDVSGRTLRHGRLGGSAGTRIWMWDGRDDHGGPVAAGVYRARAFGPFGGTSISIVRIR